jgi:hypothetical protein
MAKHGAVWGFGAVTALAVALTVYLGDRAQALTADEHAFDRARLCATQGPADGDCVENIAGVAAGPTQHKYKSSAVKLIVATSATDVTLTFPHGVGAAFDRVRIGDSVALTGWRGSIVSATAEGATELTPAAPAERYRSRLIGVFFAASLTLVLAGMTLFSAMLTERFATDLRRRIRFLAVAFVMFTGVATTVGGAVLVAGGSEHAALMTVPIVVVVGSAIAGGVVVWAVGSDRYARGSTG